jgi:hypothetical protein
MLVVALLGFPITKVLSVALVGGATGGTITGAPTGSVVSTKMGSFVQDENIAIEANRTKKLFFVIMNFFIFKIDFDAPQ